MRMSYLKPCEISLSSEIDPEASEITELRFLWHGYRQGNRGNLHTVNQAAAAGIYTCSSGQREKKRLSYGVLLTIAVRRH